MKSFLRQIEESFQSLEEKQERWQDSDGDGKWYEPGEDVKEELDPVSKEDSDIDNDGDEDSSDEYLANRRKKISKAINTDDNRPECNSCYGSGCDDCEKTGMKPEYRDLDEMSTTGGVAGYNTPAPFITPAQYETKKKTMKYERVQEAMDRKYEQLIEGYRDFALGNSKLTPEQKVKKSISEVAKQLKTIEETIKYTTRLKTESGISHSGFGNSTKNALTKISERLIKISERVRSLGE